MDNLQKIVVLCAVAALVAVVIITGYKTAEAPELTNEGTAQIDPPSMDLDAGPAVDDIEEVPSVPPADTVTPEVPDEPVACTADAKICPDGTGVGRVGPNCEFATCPEAKITSYEECVEAGYPMIKTYPAKCIADGESFTQIIEEDPDLMTPGTTCTDEQKQAEMCTMQYAPVCGYVEVQCITSPCYPVPQTFGNTCGACSTDNVVSYTQGACEI